jgi:HJR/Mrr/RecB family endonuclease
VGITDSVAFDRAQSKSLCCVVGGLLQAAIVEHEAFGLAMFHEKFAIVSTTQSSGDFGANLISVETGTIEKRGGG